MYSLTIRREAEADIPAIRELTSRAFVGKPYSKQREAQIVESLRDADVLTLSFIVVKGPSVAGHVAAALVPEMIEPVFGAKREYAASNVGLTRDEIALLVVIWSLIVLPKGIAGLIFDPPRRIVLTGFFNLTPVWNRGVSFGLFAGHQEWIPWILSLVAVAIAAGLFVWLRRAEHRLLALALGAVIGGALGNVIDRLRFGAVVDFLDFHISGYHWPAFNVADAAISLGVVMILYHELFLASGQSSGGRK